MTEKDELLEPGAHYDLVIATREALWQDNRSYPDAELLIRRFGFKLIDDEHGIDWGRTLMDGDQEDLLKLARHLGTAPKPAESDTHQTAAALDAYTELAAAETALREVVRTAIGSAWIEDFDDAKRTGLEAKRTEEDRRRDGVTVSQDLLDYTEAYHLETLILKHWEKVHPILQDKKRTEAHLKTMLSVRNTIAHARPVAPFERYLLAGVAGQIQNLLSVYRSQSTGPDAYYSSINYVRDSFGEEVTNANTKQSIIPRLSVGQIVTFECSASDPKARQLTWSFSLQADTYPRIPVTLGAANGTTAIFEWHVTEEHVGENQTLTVFVRNSSKYQRNGGSDGSVSLRYHVNPPI